MDPEFRMYPENYKNRPYCDIRGTSIGRFCRGKECMFGGIIRDIDSTRNLQLALVAGLTQN